MLCTADSCQILSCADKGSLTHKLLPSQGVSPLMTAALCSTPELVQHLLSGGADASIKDATVMQSSSATCLRTLKLLLHCRHLSMLSVVSGTFICARCMPLVQLHRFAGCTGCSLHEATHSLRKHWPSRKPEMRKANWCQQQ